MGKSSGSNVPIIVAAITVTGTIAGAVIANWDKIVPASALHPRQEAERPAATQAPESAAEEREDGAAERSSSGAGEAINVGGTWYGYEAIWEFRQDGREYDYEGHRAGIMIASGKGRLEGSRMNHSYAGENGVGECRGVVSGDGKVMDGVCTTNLGTGRAILSRQ